MPAFFPHFKTIKSFGKSHSHTVSLRKRKQGKKKYIRRMMKIEQERKRVFTSGDVMRASMQYFICEKRVCGTHSREKVEGRR